MTNQPTLNDLRDYLPRLEARLANTSSAWMKAEVQKAISLCKTEIAKQEAR